MAGANRNLFSIIVTRPEPAASRTVSKLKALGVAASAVPLTEIHAIPVPDVSGAFDAAIVTSANAVDSAPLGLIEKLRSKPTYAIGAATAEALRNNGFNQVILYGPDAAALAQKVADTVKPTARIAYLCGRNRKSTVENALLAFDLVPIEGYHAPVVQDIQQLMLRALKREKPTHILSYSRRASVVLADIFSKIPRCTILFACISENAAEPLRERNFQVVAAKKPNEEDIFELLGLSTRS